MKNGKVYTPDNIVDFMLSGLNIKKDSRILEPSCGMGAFLSKLENLSDNVDAYDLDEAALNYDRVHFKKVNYRLKDYLDVIEGNYDFIIGNPPYIRFQDLDELTRFKLKHMIIGKSGNPDLYYAFIEKSVSLLKPNGVLCFIIPNTWIINTHAKVLRVFLTQYDVSVFDYQSEKVFDDADTYTCILTLRKSNNNDTIEIKSKTGSFNVLKSDVVNGEPWVNKGHVDQKYDCINIKNGVCTLADKVFIFEESENGEYYSRQIGKYVKLEPELVKRIWKATTMEQQYCLFPYDQLFKPINLDKYPLTREYLTSCKDVLEARDYDDVWYTYGRSQGLSSYGTEKLIISLLASPDYGFKYKIIRDKDCLVYSGFYQTNKFDEMIQVLENKNVLNYVLENGSKKSGGFAAFSKKLLKPFIDTENVFK